MGESMCMMPRRGDDARRCCPNGMCWSEGDVCGCRRYGEDLLMWRGRVSRRRINFNNRLLRATRISSDRSTPTMARLVRMVFVRRRRACVRVNGYVVRLDVNFHVVTVLLRDVSWRFEIRRCPCRRRLRWSCGLRCRGRLHRDSNGCVEASSLAATVVSNWKGSRREKGGSAWGNRITTKDKG